MTGTEVEALHLEQNLIKRHRPPFNVRLRDDKSFPYIAVTVEDEYPRVMFTRERHRRGVVYFGPYANAKKVRETLDVLNRVFAVPSVRGAEAGPPLGRALPRLPHRPLPGALRRLRLGGGLPGGDRRRDRVPLRRDAADPRRARAQDARGGGRGALRGRGALSQPAPVRAAPRRAAGRRSPLGGNGGRGRNRRRGRPCGRADLPAARWQADRPAQLPPRQRGRPGPDHDPRGVLHRVLRLGAERAAGDRRPARRGRPVGARRVPVEPARRARRAARGRARREAPAPGARDRERPTRAPGRRRGGGAEAHAPGRGARGAARGAQPREPADPDRVLRHLQHSG